MLKKLLLAAISTALVTGLSVPAAASPCRDGKGKFTKCPAKATPKRCRDAKGHFAKCGTPGAKPA